MSDQRIIRAFLHADALVGRACGQLEALRATYALAAGLPDDVRLGRMAALDAKIDYLRGLPLKGDVYPWSEDSFGGEIA